MILWRSASSASGERLIYAGIVFLALGKSGQKLAENFLHYQLQQKINSKDQDTIPPNIWLTAPSIVGYIITISTFFIENDKTYEQVFRFAALLMGGAFLLFLFGCVWYRREELAGESNVRKIQRICKAGLRKRKSNYPTTGDSYYWKGYKQAHLYEHGEGLRLLPRVPRQFRWLDKPAILKAEEDHEDVSDAETQEKKGNLCTVKDVREVKSLVPMIYLFVAFFAHSLLMASRNTFFIAQAGSIEDTENRNYVWILILITDGMNKISRFVCFVIASAFGWFKGMENGGGRLKRKSGTIIRIGFGMSCAVVCGVVAWYFEHRRRDSKKGVTTVTLIPQFLLLGMSEGLVNGGLENLFKGHVAKSMWRFEDSFIEVVFGVGELLIIPFIFTSWIQNSVEESHLENLYLMLAILNAVFLLGFAYYSIRYTYGEECPEDEKVTVEETSETA
ncbi:protein NRT1/ PTR FAMILY 5.4-like [Phaseolus vulgaris]|uniref:protein NRT1/ PTR FAMILY 5.4-like n=1 Tax=Phaseolus vulgaris TaxID=3885 RepID=UPI0035CB0122